MAKGVQPNGEMPMAIDEKYQFSAQDNHAVVLVEWDATKPLKFETVMELYDLGNRSIGATKGRRISIGASKKAAATWTFSLVHFLPGIYRVDVRAGSDVVWRTFFRMEK